MESAKSKLKPKFYICNQQNVNSMKDEIKHHLILLRQTSKYQLYAIHLLARRRNSRFNSTHRKQIAKSTAKEYVWKHKRFTRAAPLSLTQQKRPYWATVGWRLIREQCSNSHTVHPQHRSRYKFLPLVRQHSPSEIGVCVRAQTEFENCSFIPCVCASIEMHISCYSILQ